MESLQKVVQVFNKFTIFVLGTYIMSFLNCVCGRMVRGENFVNLPSHCEACGHILEWYENVPVVSCLILEGKCSRCGGKFGYHHAITEALSGAAFLMAYNITDSVGNFIIMVSTLYIFMCLLEFAGNLN